VTPTGIGSSAWLGSGFISDFMTLESLNTATLHFFPGTPTEDGYYLVELEPGHTKPYDIDYCRAKSPSDGPGREWVAWYPHNVVRWAALPSVPNVQDERDGWLARSVR
jgi:hypothetical protein